MKIQTFCLSVLTFLTAITQALNPHVNGWGRSLPRNGGAASDWTREAQRNLSRWESRLLRNTLQRHHSSHVLGKVPFDLFNPVVTCPPPSKLMRLDPDGPNEHPTKWVDGAKWMCVPFPRTAHPGCVVLSFGSNDQFEFERAALDMTPCTVHTLDCTTGMLGNATHFESIDPARHSFHPYCVGGRELAMKNPKQVLTWEGILRAVRPQGTAAVRQGGGGGGGRGLRSGPAGSAADDGGGDGSVGRRLQQGGVGAGGRRRRDPGPEVFVLKIDVEGFEWQLLSEWGPHTPGLPAFLAIEIHNWVESTDLLPPSPPPPPPPPPPPRARMNALVWWLYGKRATARAAVTDADAAADARAAALAAVWARRQRVYGGELSLLFLHLARLGYAVVAREDNPNGDFEAKLCCAEFLFIRVRGPEEGRPGVWDWTGWLTSVKDRLRQGLLGGAARGRE